MSANKTCKCGMYRNKGYCYHTGYRPFQRIPDNPVKAVKAMLAARAYDKQQAKGKR